LLAVQSRPEVAEAIAEAFDQMGRTAWAANIRTRARKTLETRATA
jgi:hypothetical protein